MNSDAIHTTLKYTKDFNLIRQVVEKNIESINVVDNEYYTPLRLALVNKHSIEVIDLLLKSGAYAYNKDGIRYFIPYLETACLYKNKIEVIELLLKYGADKDISCEMFQWLIDNAQTREVEYLLTRHFENKFKTKYNPHRNRNVCITHPDERSITCNSDMELGGSLSLPNNWKIDTTENELKIFKNNKEVFVVSDQQELPPMYEDALCSEFDVLMNLKENQKLRRVDNKVCIETRGSMSRTFSNDNRHRVYEDLKRLSGLAKTPEDLNKLKHAIQVLMASTYKNDAEWKQKASEISLKF